MAQGVCALAAAEDRAEERVMTMVREGADCAGIGHGHRRHVSWLRSGMPCQRHGARAVSSLAARSRRRNPEAAPFRRCGQRSVNLACTASGRMPHKHGTRGRASVGRNFRNSAPELTRKTTQRRRPPIPAQPRGPNGGVAARIGTWRGRGGAAPRVANTTKLNDWCLPDAGGRSHRSRVAANGFHGDRDPSVRGSNPR